MDCCQSMDPVTQPFDFLILLTLGFTISLGHCVGMCGPLVTAFSIAQKGGERRVRLWPRLLLYHLGRVASYMLLGAAIGLIGSTVFLASQGKQIQGAFSVFVAVMMLLFGMGMLGWLPTQRWVEGGLWTKRLAPKVRELLAARGAPKIWMLGMANGLLPCGPVFAALMTAAATASLWKGAVAMFAFGLGTIPVLVVLGLTTGHLSLRWRTVMNRVGAVMVLLVGTQLLLRGLAAWGLIGHLAFGEFVIY